MKFTAKIALALCLCMLLVSLAACAKKPQDEPAVTDDPAATGEATAEPTEEATEEATEEPSAEPTEEAAEPTEEATGTPEEMVAKYAEQNAAAMDAMKESLAGTMDFDAFAEGTAYVMQYKYLTEEAATAEALVESLDAQASVYKPIYEELSAFAGSDEVSVVLRYLTNKGETILDYVVNKEYVEIH